MSKFAVIGLGRFGYKLAVTISEEGGEVIAIDKRHDFIESIKDKVTVAISMDAADEQALQHHGIDKVDTAVVCIGEKFESNVLVTAILKKMGVPRVYARASEGIQSRILTHVGADRVIHPEEDMAYKLGQNLMISSIIDVIPVSSQHNAAQIEVPQSFWNKTIMELELRNKYHINLIAIKEKDQDGNMVIVDSLPGPETVIKRDQILILVGKTEDIDKIVKLK